MKLYHSKNKLRDLKQNKMVVVIIGTCMRDDPSTGTYVDLMQKRGQSVNDLFTILMIHRIIKIIQNLISQTNHHNHNK